MSEDYFPLFLHRYRPVEDLEKGYLREVLLDNKIYVPSPALFNDPFDCKARFQRSDDPRVWRRLLDRHLRKYEPSLGYAARTKRITSLMSRGLWRKSEVHAAVERELQEYMNSCGILCLCESGTVPLMWAHYASGHRGFCLRFHSQPETIFRQIERVEYSLEYPVPSLSGDIEVELHTLFQTKAKWWEYEKEWRFIGNREGVGHRIFPAEALSAVILGCRVSSKDAALVDDLWENIVLYMQHSRYGIVIFEDIEDRDFNPNISLELGFMYALKKRCLLLKEKRMPRLPTDICGRIYRNFDSYNIATSIESEIRNWCVNDLGLQETREGVETFDKFGVVAFDNRSDDPEFSTWSSVSSDGLHVDHLALLHPKAAANPEEAVPVMKLSTGGVEYVGLNKAVPFLRGRVRFEYMAVSSSATNLNLMFYMIPMKGILADLIEVGAQRRSEPANAYSPYRERYFVPEGQIGDGRWHYASIEFDFTKNRDASYSIFAPRINEGCPRPGAGELKIRNVELYVASEDIEAPPNTAVPPDLFRATRSTGR